MIKVLDNEGELEVTLTDIDNYEQLQDKFSQENKDVIKILRDIPLFGYMLVSKAEYDRLRNVHGPMAAVSLKDDSFELETATHTYESWMNERCYIWFREYALHALGIEDE